MSGTTTHLGLPYPDPTDPLAHGAEAIKYLAVAVDSALPVFVINNTGTIIAVSYDPVKPIVPVPFMAAVGGDPNGVVTVPTPPGMTAVLAVTAIADSIGGINQVIVTFQAGAPAGGPILLLVKTSTGPWTQPMTISGVMYCQFGASSKPAPDRPEVTPQ